MRKSHLTKFMLCVAAGSHVCFSAAVSASEPFPNQPIKIVVPYPPGGAVDTVGRVLAPVISKAYGNHPLVIENHGGAAGSIGTSAVMQAKPDGHTVLFHSSTVTTTATFQHEAPRFDVGHDLAPVAMIGASPFLVVVNPALPIRSIQELIAYARANPGKLSYGSSGHGSSNHLAAELFKRMAEVDILHVPYQGGGPVQTALLAGQIDVGFDTILGAGKLVEAGKLRALAVTSRDRSPTLPNIPSVAESGLPDYDAGFWLGFFAPANTPPSILDAWASSIDRASSEPPVVERLGQFGFQRVAMPRTQFAKAFAQEVEQWAEVSSQLGKMK